MIAQGDFSPTGEIAGAGFPGMAGESGPEPVAPAGPLPDWILCLLFALVPFSLNGPPLPPGFYLIH